MPDGGHANWRHRGCTYAAAVVDAKGSEGKSGLHWMRNLHRNQWLSEIIW